MNGSVLWVIIVIVGAIISNSNKKKKKAAEEAKRQQALKAAGNAASAAAPGAKPAETANPNPNREVINFDEAFAADAKPKIGEGMSEKPAESGEGRSSKTVKQVMDEIMNSGEGIATEGIKIPRVKPVPAAAKAVPIEGKPVKPAQRLRPVPKKSVPVSAAENAAPKAVAASPVPRFTAKTMRDAVIVSEILNRPVSLRRGGRAV